MAPAGQAGNTVRRISAGSTIGAIVAITLIVAGCGSGGGETGIPTAQITRTAYVARADAVCAKWNAVLERKETEYFGHLGLGPTEDPTGKQLAKFASESGVPAIEDQLKQLRALKAPAAEVDQITEIYDAAQAANDRVRANPSLIGGGNPYGRANALADDYGLTVCGSG
jgi:hypothetical protein